MSSSKELRMQSLLATFVADAAQMGSHWIYDAAKLKELLEQHWEEPEFHEPPSCPFYDSEKNPGHYASGDPSPYAEECLALLNFLENCGGNFESGDAFAESLKSWAKQYTGRKNHATKLFEENVEKLEAEGKTSLYPACGADDPQANAFWKVVPITTRYAEEDNFFELAEQAIRTHQNNDEAVAYGLGLAQMLQDVLAGTSLEDAIQAGAQSSSTLVAEAVQKALENRATSPDDISQENLEAFLSQLSSSLFKEGMNEMYKPLLSKTCGFPQSFIVGLKIVLDTLTAAPADPFEYAIRMNIHAGGDTCGRTPVIASLLAASGFAPPDAWVKKTNHAAAVEKIGELLVSSK